MSNGPSRAAEADFTPITPARLQWQDHTPVATDFDDPYFSRQDGRAESLYVFLDGNQLDRRFAALADGDRFVIGETGFGTGLNMLLAAQRFLALAPAGAGLELWSVEKHPLQRDDLARALAHWPELGEPARALLDQYPPASPGYHRLQLADNVTLTLMLGDAEALWRQCPADVDAWFLDGFAPARNPDMWQAGLFAELAAHSRPGATLATFTAAGFVRRGLIEAGFAMRRRDGFGGKRHMLAGHFGDGVWQPARARRGHALVAGAGLAGATTARALAERGWRVTVLDPAGIAAGASGNRAGVVYSTPSAHLTEQNRFYQLSYVHALRWLQRHRFPGPDQGRLNGVPQHFVDDKQADKIRAARDSGAWPQALLKPLGEHGMELVGGGYLSPPAWCRQLLDHPAIEPRLAAVSEFQPATDDRPVRVRLSDDHTLEADALILATAGAARDLAGLAWLPLKTIRGQVSYCRPTAASAAWQQAHCHGGYLTPTLDGVHCVGATFDLHQLDPAPRDSDDAANLAQLRHHLPREWQELGGESIEVVDRRVAMRCQSLDFLPLVGPLPDAMANPHTALPGLYLNIAHGSRGITGTPLCADLLADQLSRRAPPADQALVAALAPERFILRKRKKQPDWSPPCS